MKQAPAGYSICEKQHRAGSNQNRASTTWWNSPLLTKDLNFSKHKAVVAVFGQQFIKTNIFDHKFHKYLVEAFEQRQIGDLRAIRRDHKRNRTEEYREGGRIFGCC